MAGTKGWTKSSIARAGKSSLGQGSPLVRLAPLLLCLAALLIWAPAAFALTVTPAMTWWATGPGDRFDAATSVAVAPDGALYVAGQRTTATHGTDIALSRVGHGSWIRIFDSRVHGWDSPSTVLVGRDGSVFVVGTSTRTASQSGKSDIVIIRYAADGTRVWTRRWASSVGSLRAFRAILDDGNHVIVLGNRVVTGRQSVTTMPVLARFTQHGARMWDLLYSHYAEAESADLCRGVNGSIYFCGLGISAEGSYQGFLLKVSVLGRRQLTATYHPGGATCSFIALAPCPGGGVYVCDRGSSGSSLLRYTPTGFIPTVLIQTEGEGAAVFTDVAVDSAGRIDVCGWARLATEVPHDGPYVAQFDSSGAVQWSAQSDPVTVADGSYPQLALTADDALVVTSVSTPTPTTYTRKAATFCYEASGTLRWDSLWDAPVSGTAWTGRVTIGNGRAYISGTAERPGSGSDEVLLGYELEPVTQ